MRYPGARNAREREARNLAYDPEKWEPVFRKDYASTNMCCVTNGKGPAVLSSAHLTRLRPHGGGHGTNNVPSIHPRDPRRRRGRDRAVRLEKGEQRIVVVDAELRVGALLER